ncbi:MAG TPA: glycine cleavage system aminomethyltransferase GcvT [Candidatus Binataceae bacterium]|nr:glycine cleavage system aminomethyltransferase GcvT [Candidatus Binataceae bacterium]
MVAEAVKRTPLYETHRRLGARMTEFAGFAMPLQYRGILEEHRAVRTAAGLFDLSHMGEFMVQGPGALSLLEATLTNSAARLAEGQAQYTIMCADDGGTIDDLIVCRLGADQYMLCVNAANIAADWEALAAAPHPEVILQDISDGTALVAVQGPHAVRILAPMAASVERMRRFHVIRAKLAGSIESTIARTGYTGEDGFEIFVAARDAAKIFELLLEAGADCGLQPCGLGSRDTLRLEAALPLYGHELDRATSPLEAGLGAFVKFGHGFRGEAALAVQRDRGVRKSLVGIRTDDGKAIARQGYPLWSGNRPIGAVTSGTYAPTFARPLALGYVEAAAGFAPGSALEVEIRGRRVSATVVALPFYRRAGSRN